MIAFFAALGFGSLVAAFISWNVAIAGHRQNWINALRDDIATFLKELQGMHYALGDLIKGEGEQDKLEKAKREARVALLAIYYRIVLRLNTFEELHIELKGRLDALLADFMHKVPQPDKIEETVVATRKVLGREWAVTKYGPYFAPKVTKWKGREW